MERINQKIAEMNNSSFSSQKDDERFWYPDTDKAGNGSAVIRFLPEINDESLPFVRVFTHSFQGPNGQWYIETCPTTLGKKCPVCEHNNKLWNSGNESDKAIVRARKRKVSYISNVYIVSDPANPENNGTVKLYKYGVKIYNMINGAMNPEFDDMTPFNPFDLWEGATFRLRIRQADGFRNYDKSSFDAVGPLHDDDSVLEEIFNQQFDLNEFLAADKFKEYDDLKSRHDRVVGLADDSDIKSSSKRRVDKEDTEDEDLDAKVDAALEGNDEDDDDDDVYAKFKDLADE